MIGNVYLLTRGVAKLFNSGKLAGCVVSDELLEKCEKYAAGPDKGQAFFRELAAKQLAVFRGLGFAAGYIGGIVKLETSPRSSTWPKATAADDWREFIKEIQFRSRTSSSFSSTIRDEAGHARSVSIRSLSPRWPRPAKSKEVTLGYRLSRLVHRLAFTRGQGLHGLMQRLFRRWTRSPASAGAWSRAGKGIETRHYGCRDCGDCSLPECAYLCPRYPVPSAAATGLRRIGRRALRTGRQGMHLGPHLRAAEELRRVADDARRPAGDL